MNEYYTYFEPKFSHVLVLHVKLDTKLILNAFGGSEIYEPLLFIVLDLH